MLVPDGCELVVRNESKTVYYAVAFFLPLFSGLNVLDLAVSVTDLGDSAAQMYRNVLERQSLSQE